MSYAMNTRPDTWPAPDHVDIIQAQERFEASGMFQNAVRMWMIDDDASFDFAAARFTMSDMFDSVFEVWMTEQGQR